MRELRLTTQITADFLDRVESELISIFHDCLMAHRRRFMHPGFYSVLFALGKLLSASGLALSFLLCAMGGFIYHSVRIDVVFILLFSLLLAVFWNKQKRMDKLWTSYRPYWMWLARKRANRMLKAAKKTAPFAAEYDFRGDLAVYYRTKNESAEFVWARKIKGFHLAGSGFTLLFKKQGAIYPYAIILHAPSTEFESYVDESGVRPFERFTNPSSPP